MNAFKVNETTRQLLMEDNKLIRKFIRDFKGGKGDEEDFSNLQFEIDCNRLGIPVTLQDKIDQFITDYLKPMVYEPDTVFTESCSVGRIVDGIRHIDTDEEVFTMLAEYFFVLHKTMETWDNFAMEELYQYIMQQVSR